MSSSPLTAMASCLASGLHARPSGWGRLELRCLGAAGALGVAAAGEPLAGALELGVATGSATLIGSITAPWSGRATATVEPSGVMAIGPSSGPSARGNGLSTPASALSQYQPPVPNSRTAINPEPPGAAPSVKNAACAGGLARTLSGPSGCVTSSASTSYVAQHPTVSA